MLDIRPFSLKRDHTLPTNAGEAKPTLGIRLDLSGQVRVGEESKVSPALKDVPERVIAKRLDEGVESAAIGLAYPLGTNDDPFQRAAFQILDGAFDRNVVLDEVQGDRLTQERPTSINPGGPES